MTKQRFFIVCRDKENLARTETDLKNGKCPCSIHDRYETEPNPEYDGKYKRYKQVESGLTYFEAFPKCKQMNMSYYYPNNTP